MLQKVRIMTKESSFKKTLLLVISLAAVGQITNTIYVPAMAMMAHSLHIIPRLIQSVMAVYLIAYGGSQFIYGPLSDRFGRRPLIFIGLVVFLTGSAIATFASTFHCLLWGSFIQGVGIGVGGVMARTVMRDLYEGKQLHRATSYVSVALVFAPIVAPGLGGLLAGFLGWRANFVFLGLFGSVVLVTQFLFLPETNHFIGAKKKFMAGYFSVLADPKFVGYMICLLVSFAGISVFEASSGLIFTHVLGYSPQMTSVLFVLPLPGYVLGSYLSGKLAYRFQLKQIILLGVVLLAIGSLSMMLTPLFGLVDATAILISASFYMMGAGILFPAATTGAIEPFPALAGTAAAVLGGMQNLGAGFATVLSSFMKQVDQMPMGFILVGLTILVIFTYLCFIGPFRVED